MGDEMKQEKKPEKIQEKKSVKKTVSVTFKENRKFDLHVNRKMITFKGRETKEISFEDLESKDFKQVAKLFVVRSK